METGLVNLNLREDPKYNDQISPNTNISNEQEFSQNNNTNKYKYNNIDFNTNSQNKENNNADVDELFDS